MKIQWVQNKNKGPKTQSLEFLSNQEVQKVWNFHRSFPQYERTPLRSLQNLSKELGVGGIYVKDEAYRFGLNAFKVLGGAYAIGKYIAKKLQVGIEDLSFEKLTSKAVKEKIGDITFTSATDGNHGRGVAWAAQQLGQKAVIYMPKGSSLIRLNNIKATGAEAYITDLNYDDAVRLASENADKYGWVMVQDTAWEGYTDIPNWIMQGYATLAAEALQQLEEMEVKRPSHLFLQAGVGSFAGALQGFFASAFPDNVPITTIVEPDKADCIFRSAVAADGKPRIVTGDLDTIMAGLACGEPNPIGWNILWDYSKMFISCPDYIAAKGMRMLGNPLGDDIKVVSGESGAVTTGMLATLMQKESLKEAQEIVGLNQDSHILIVNTEGDTDPENYRKIVWDGKYPSDERSDLS